MLDQLTSMLMSAYRWAIFWVVIDHYEQGIVLTLGRFRGRVLQPGLHLKWPLGIDVVPYDNVVPRPFNSQEQTLETADKRTVTLATKGLVSIIDIEKALLASEGADLTLDAVLSGTVSELVMETNYEEIDGLLDSVRETVNDRLEPYGMEIIDVWWENLAPIRTYRLLM